MYNADRPLTDRARDELGLAALADEVGGKILGLQPRDGLVVGLQSPWGMGKSTFLNFLTQTLEDDPRVLVVRFAPWLVDDRDALLHELFTELAGRLEPVERRRSQRWDVEDGIKRRAVAKRIRQFSRLAKRMKALPKAPELAWAKSVAELPVVREVLAVGAFAISSAAALGPKDPTLRELRNDISQRLALLAHKIIVVIDDVDRLEAAEAREVFRLVRAVADFPNTTYLVAFDREPLNLDAARQNDITRSYLDKVIQVPIVLPEAESVDLRRLLNSALVGGNGRDGALKRPLRTDPAGGSDAEDGRLAAAMDPLVRTYLNSPRRIGIVENILKTSWDAISEDADICDFLIHTCLVNFDRPLASWVDDYLAVAASRRWSRLDTNVVSRMRTDLTRLMEESLRHRADRMELLRLLLPSLSAH